MIFDDLLKGQPKFRLKQVRQAIFVDLIENWDNNTTLPKDLRSELQVEFPLEINSKISNSKESETVKALITFLDGMSVETVLLRHKDGRRTVCVSSQIGCSLGCLFCATGKMGLKRNLNVWEIIQQVLFFARVLRSTGDEKSRVTNVVFMGMGEPFLNYDNVLEAIGVFNDPDCLGIGSRHISISTCGVLPGIRKLSESPLQLNLAVSLHAPNEKLRSKLMPINDKYPLSQLLQIIEEYVEKKSRRVMFEYMLIDNVNDTEKCAEELADIMDHRLYVVNLIRYNPTGKYNPSKSLQIKKFKDVLLKRGISFTQRHAFGGDIDAACGQLAGKRFLKG